MKILFVCTGNTCRSYMAEAIAKDYLKQVTTLPIVPEIISAGTAAFDGEPPSSPAETALAELGIEMKKHRALTITKELIREADLILAMTGGQKASILRLEPQAAAKVFLLKEYAAGGEESYMESYAESRNDILDPFGQPVDYYRECAVELRRYVVKALHKYLRLRSSTELG